MDKQTVLMLIEKWLKSEKRKGNHVHIGIITFENNIPHYSDVELDGSFNINDLALMLMNNTN